jgi:pimeloyl-ACP methyl ester carboxylesterase
VPLENAELILDDPALGEVVLDAVVAGPDDGEPVLLLHGWPQTSLEWSRVIPALAESGMRCLAPDQRGYSPAVRPDDVASYELPHLVNDALGALDAVGWESAHIVGHDWGAVVAWALAAQHPERARSLTAVSVPHPQAFNKALKSDPVQWKKSAYLALFRTAPGKAAKVLMADGGKRLRDVYGTVVDPSDVDQYVAFFSEEGAMEAALRWYAAMGGDHFKEIGPVAVPTTFIWGTEDVAIGAQAARGSGEWCTGPYSLVVLNGRGHWIPDEEPEAVVAAVLGLAGRGPGARPGDAP